MEIQMEMKMKVEKGKRKRKKKMQMQMEMEMHKTPKTQKPKTRKGTRLMLGILPTRREKKKKAASCTLKPSFCTLACSVP